MFRRWIWIPLIFAATAAPLASQEDAEAIKKRLLEKIREKLQTEHKRILQRVEKLIDEELSRKPQAEQPPKAAPTSDWDKKIADLEKQKRKLDLQKEEMDARIRRFQRFKEDAALAEESKKSGPQDGQEAQELFDVSLEQHNAKDFEKSIAGFKKIFYNFPESQFGATSAYNVACGYALAGDRDRAIDWLEISVAAGFNSFDHIREDADLESLRDHVRFKKLLADK